MKKTSILLCVVLTFVFFAGIPEVLAVMKEAAPASALNPGASVQPGPPDLAVTVKIVHVESWTKDDGTKCYSPRPYFTITNKGQSAANNFDYIIEWKLGPGHTWQVYTSSNPTISLKPGETKTIDGNQPSWEQPWCGDPDWKPGWRISADTKKTVAESNETNNVAEKFFEPSIMIKRETPKAIKKEIQPAPVQNRTPMRIR